MGCALSKATALLRLHRIDTIRPNLRLRGTEKVRAGAGSST